MTALEPGTAIEDRYVVEACIGRGGMGLVYRVRHEALGTLHALKVLLSSTAVIRDRLQMEGRAQAAMHHPNLVSVTDWVVIGGAPGIVMEYVRGPSLEILLGDRRLDTPQIDALAVGILDGVAAAHAHRVVHRDLKPANVLLGVTPTALVPKVSDFGLVKVLTDDDDDRMIRTRPGMPMGTPAYMAPEQIRDPGTVDVRADVWSLGVVLFELVTGSRAFPDLDLIALYTRIGAGDRPSVRDLAPYAPARWVQAIDAALATDRDRRVGSVRELRALWLDGSTPPAEPWNAGWIERATALGAGGLPATTFLRRSLRSHPSRPVPRSAGPTHVATTTAGESSAPRGRRWAVLALGLAAVGFLVGSAGSVGIAGAWWVTRPAPREDVVVAPIVEPVEVPVEAPAPVEVPAPVEAPDPVVAPVRPRPEPRPRPVEAAPVPVRAAETTLAVQVRGLTVEIVGPDGKPARTGTVRPGRYVVRGLLDAGGVIESTELLVFELLAGEQAKLTCDPGGCAVAR